MKKLLLALISTNGFSQDQNDAKVYLNHADRIECISKFSKPIHHFDPALTYYWCFRNTLNSTQGEAGGELLHGEYRCNSRNRQLIEKGNFRKGLKHGRWTRWNAIGKIIEISDWRKGRLHGKTCVFDEEGALIYKIIFSSGIPKYQQCFIDGRLESECRINTKDERAEK